MEKTSALQAYVNFMQKQAFSVTEKGHEWDAQRAEARQKHMEDLYQQLQDRGAMGYRDDEGEKHRGGILSAMRFQDPDQRSGLGNHPRHQAYVAKKHRAGGNAWNPFGGLLTPTEREGAGGTAMRIGKYRDAESKAE